MPQIVETSLLVYVESGANSNKFYRLQLHNDGSVHKMWGRVPAGSAELSGQTQTEFGGKPRFDRIRHEKMRKGYTPVQAMEHSAAPKADVADVAHVSLAGGSTDPVVKTLVERLVSANRHNLVSSSGGVITVDTSGQARTALGVITASAVRDARALLDQMVAEKDASRRGELTEQYLRLVPQGVDRSLGRGWAPGWLTSVTTPARQRDLLDALEASASFADASRTKSAKVAADEDFFRYRVTRLDEASEEFTSIVARFHDTAKSDNGHATTLKPRYIYRLEDRKHGAEIAQTAERLRNVQRLWHGSGAANVLSILHKGLFVPPTSGSGIHIAGRMFGDGIYLSRTSTKSLRYSTGQWGGGRSPSTFMFLTLTAMGYEYRPDQAMGRFTRFVKPSCDENGKAYDSVNVLPGKAGVINHEAIVENPMQVNLQWLVEF